ncbi:MAG: agmatine deiminase family protein [Luminiphilus sp.]|jgi:agmatine deiminase|nr:agmatine deiminase family protein [Luminiphilus sp.]
MTKPFLAIMLLLPLSAQAQTQVRNVFDEGTPAIASAGHGPVASNGSRRVPAEWEPQEAIWLQWPGAWEKTYEEAFAAFSCIIINYEKLHVLYQSSEVLRDAKASLVKSGCNPDHELITWHDIPNDSAWMRDNGPVFVTEAGEIRVQNWQFDAWGGRFGDDVPYTLDDLVPLRVAEYLDMPLDKISIVHERGNLEFNGDDAVILNWSALGDPERNPGYTQAQAEQDLKHWFGVSKVVFIAGVPEGDRTNGHIDGIARFINTDTVVVGQCTVASLCKPGDGKTGSVLDAAAQVINDAGFTVIREPMEGIAEVAGQRFDTNYLNWLVGNGFVITTGYGVERLDLRAKARLQSYFPDRDIYVLPMLKSWAAGGGVHCHTNDQPASPSKLP